ncbi:uncharacterized protein PV09_09806 [Verruconis gallopava]|uniref:Uncharacterized protein n=1 Tax=Verruconis gallopava TaxID=253628 RepID=A0A0D2AHD6_9PEZI|nr:uncharacterized protein PV09_09806 [Verruconis gallopava]KIV98353.1 hypothetical protein PV09_09806 [Verruconis gallopava]
MAWNGQQKQQNKKLTFGKVSDIIYHHLSNLATELITTHEMSPTADMHGQNQAPSPPVVPPSNEAPSGGTTHPQENTQRMSPELANLLQALTKLHQGPKRRVLRKESSWFDGLDASDWLEEFELDLEREEVQKRDWCKEVVANSKKDVRSRLRLLDGYETGSWETFKRHLLDEFSDSDSRMMKMSVGYLTILAQSMREERIMTPLAYVGEFKQVGLRMIHEGRIGSHQLIQIFLKGFSENRRDQILDAIGDLPTPAGEKRRALPDFASVLIAGKQVAQSMQYGWQVEKEGPIGGDPKAILKKQYPGVTRRNADPTKLDKDLKQCINNLRIGATTVESLKQRIAVCEDPVLKSGKQNSTQMGHIISYVESLFPTTTQGMYANQQAREPISSVGHIRNMAPAGQTSRLQELWCCANDNQPHRHATGCPLLQPLMDSRQIHWDKDIKAFRWGAIGSGGDTIPLARFSQCGKTQRQQIDELMEKRPTAATNSVQVMGNVGEEGYFMEYDRVARATVANAVTPDSQPMRATVKTVRSGRICEIQDEEEEPCLVAPAAEVKGKPTLQKYLKEVPHEQTVVNFLERLMNSTVQVSMMESLQLMPEIRSAMYRSLPPSIANEVQDQLAAAKEARRVRLENQGKQKSRTAGIKQEEMVIGALYGGDLAVRELTSDYIAQQDRLNNRQRIASPLPMVLIRAGSSRQEVKALIDTGASTNCMSEEFAHENGLVLNQISPGMLTLQDMRAANQGKMHCVGWVATRLHLVGSEISYDPVIFAVFRNLSLGIILGNDWISIAQLETHHMGDGSCICRAHAPDGSKSVRWVAAKAITEYPAMRSPAEDSEEMEEIAGNE